MHPWNMKRCYLRSQTANIMRRKLLSEIIFIARRGIDNTGTHICWNLTSKQFRQIFRNRLSHYASLDKCILRWLGKFCLHAMKVCLLLKWQSKKHYLPHLTIVSDWLGVDQLYYHQFFKKIEFLKKTSLGFQPNTL